ncbi:MAG TPA: spermidine/putrescine ABC transporter substrate-binding protein [Caulobacteraceae bacterium]|jgi:spermidine/putrescine transport system substrate-binding protein|nr:spermidine/putrescine ABC transporter substrate-binding protein [Caulobacteraceae bacterium]
MNRSRPKATRRSLLAGLGAAAAGISFGGLEGCAESAPLGRNGEEQRLNLYNWDTYTGKTTLADFKAATGITVKMSLFATNDELFSKLKAGNPGFDVIVPSNEYVTRLRIAGLLQPLDLAKIPNRANLLPAFQNPAFDPGRRWSMPYTWLVLGIGYRKSRIRGVPDSWKWVMDSDRYKGRIGLFSEADDLIELGAKYLGHSVNDIPLDMVDRVARMYIRQKPNIKIFHNDEGQDLLLAGDIDIVMEYNGDIAQVMAEDPDLDFVVPREGSILNSDCLCIPRGARRPDNAHQFINFILDGRNGAEIYQTIKYPTPNAAALALMPLGYRDNPVIFPPPEVMAKCEYARFEGLSRAQLYDETLTRIFAS